MIKDISGKILCVVFLIVFAVMAGIMIKGFIDQKKDDEQQVSRYESMKSDEGRTLLTDEILEWIKTENLGDKMYINF